MENIGSFIHIKKEDLYFKGCSTCAGDCCNGAKGFAVSPLILEDFEAVFENFPILFSRRDEKLMVYVLLNDGEHYCKYYVNHQCSIYEQRAPACKLYPISPYFEHLFVDTACTSVNRSVGKPLCRDGKLHNDFYTKRLDNFVSKLNATNTFLESINNLTHFDYVGDILGLPLFQYNQSSSNRYIQMHLESLKHFEKKRTWTLRKSVS